MSTLTAVIFTDKPTASDCDMYVELPTINRYPVLMENFNDKLLALALQAVKAGFVTLTGGPSVMPMYVSGDVISAAYNALKSLDFNMDNLLVPATLYVGFKERRLIETPPKITVHTIQWVHDGVPETNKPYLLSTVAGRLTKEHLHDRLAVEGLSNAKGDMKLFNADLVTDPQAAAHADAITSALHAAIEGIPDATIAALGDHSRNERTPIMVQFLVD